MTSRVMNPTLLLRKLKSQGVDVRSAVKGSVPDRIMTGQVQRSIRHRDDVNQVIAIANREDEFRQASNWWRSEYKWRIKSLAMKMLLSSMVAMGYWLTSSKTFGGPLPDAPPDP